MEALRNRRYENVLTRNKCMFILISVFIALCVTVMPAFASGATDDLIGKVFVNIVNYFARTIGTAIYYICYIMIAALMDVDTQTVVSVFDGMQTTTQPYLSFNSGIVDLGILLAVIIFLIEISKTMLSGVTGEKMANSPVTLAIRFFLAVGITVGIALPLSKGIWTLFADLYKSMLSNAVPNPGTTDPWSATTGQVTGAISGNNYGFPGDEVLGLVAAILSGFIFLVLYFNLFKLVLELAQRYGVTLLYVFLSPLATACYVSPSTSEITSKWFKSLITQCILMVLNGWAVALAETAVNLPLASGTTDPIEYLGYCLVAYAVIKGCQQLDDVFNNVGASVVRQNSGLLADIIGMKNSVGGVLGTVAGIKKGWDGMKSKLRDDAHSGGTYKGAVGQNGYSGKNATVDKNGNPLRAQTGKAGTAGSSGTGTQGGQAPNKAAVAGSAQNAGARSFKQMAAGAAMGAFEKTAVGSAFVGTVSRGARVAGVASELKQAKFNKGMVEKARDLNTSASVLADNKKSLDRARAAADAKLTGGEKNAYEAAAAASKTARAESDRANANLETASQKLDNAKANLDKAEKTGTAKEIAMATKGVAEKQADFDKASAEAHNMSMSANAAESHAADAKQSYEKARADVGGKELADAQKTYDDQKSEVDKQVKDAREAGVVNNDAVRATVAKAAGLTNGETITAMGINDNGTFDLAYQNHNADGDITGAGIDHQVGLASNKENDKESPFHARNDGLGAAKSVQNSTFERLDDAGNSFSVKTKGAGGCGDVDATVTGTGRYTEDGKQLFTVRDNKDGSSFNVAGADAKSVAYVVSGATYGQSAETGKSNMGAINVDVRDVNVNGEKVQAPVSVDPTTGQSRKTGIAGAIDNFNAFADSASRKNDKPGAKRSGKK